MTLFSLITLITCISTPAMLAHTTEIHYSISTSYNGFTTEHCSCAKSIASEMRTVCDGLSFHLYPRMKTLLHSLVAKSLACSQLTLCATLFFWSPGCTSWMFNSLAFLPTGNHMLAEATVTAGLPLATLRYWEYFVSPWPEVDRT